MGKGSKKGQKSRAKSKLAQKINDKGQSDQNRRSSTPDIKSLHDVLTLHDHEQNSSIENAEAMMDEATPFGFEGICKDCEQLYRSKIATFMLNNVQSCNTGTYIGKLNHINPDEKCRMCQSLYAMRWSTSVTGQYHLHAFSASRLLYGRSIKHLKATILTGWSSVSLSDQFQEIECKDNTLFAIVADREAPISISEAIAGARGKGYLVSVDLMPDGEETAPNLINDLDYDEDGSNHRSWVENQWRLSGKDRFTKASIRTALQDAKEIGFMYEYTQSWHVRSFDCTFTSKLDLNRRQGRGERELLRASIQPIDTGDPYTPGNLGYVPFSVRSNLVSISPTHILDSTVSDVQNLTTTQFFGRALNPSRIDYSLLRGWLRQCKTRCKLDDFIKERKRFQRIPFYLLDCRKREIIKVPSKRLLRYIALSYVWGDVDIKSRPQVTNLPFPVTESCSRTIEDAITVVLKLGYRYLWVDSLCVSPHASMRHEQIANMDVVYKNAELTIVAGAGSNADYGLPGVSERHRTQQINLKVGRQHLVSTSSDPLHAFKSSYYQTRGWTYQEYFFSRRRLIFSDSQVYFECRSLCASRHLQESLICPPRHLFPNMKDLEHLEDVEDAYFRKLSTHSKDTIYQPDGTDTQRELSLIDKVFVLLSYEHHVTEYTKRNLSFEGDSLQALSSILDRYMFQTHSIYHLQGIPFIPQDATYEEAGHNHAFGINYGLLWTHGVDQIYIKRRHSFPSWSWAGWDAQVNWLVSTTNVQSFEEAPLSCTKFEYVRQCPGNNRNQLQQLGSWRPSPQTKPANAIVFTAQLFKIPLIAKQRTDPITATFTDIYLKDTYLGLSRLHLTETNLSTIDIDKKTFLGLWLGKDSEFNFMLVIQETTSRSTAFGGRYFERIGVMMISRDWDGWRGPSVVQGWLV